MHTIYVGRVEKRCCRIYPLAWISELRPDHGCDAAASGAIFSPDTRLQHPRGLLVLEQQPIYLKVSEGGAIGVDPGLHRQMTEWEKALNETVVSSNGTGSDSVIASMLEKAIATGTITQDQAKLLMRTL